MSDELERQRDREMEFPTQIRSASPRMPKTEGGHHTRKKLGWMPSNAYSDTCNGTL